MQPGLRMLLKGETRLSAASEISVQDMPAEVQLSKSRQSSLHRSRRNLSVHTHRSSLGSDLLRDHPTKVRTALDPSIFQNPQAAEASPIQKRTKMLLDNSSDQQGFSQLPNTTMDRQPRAAEPLPLPPLPAPSPQVPEQMSFLKRLKFKRKFMSPHSGKSKKKNTKTKMSKGDKKSLPNLKQARTKQADMTQAESNGAQLPAERMETEAPLKDQQLFHMPRGMT